MSNQIYLNTVFFLSLLLSPLLANANERYRVDNIHTRVVFEISHAGLSNAIGSFSNIEGQLELDEADWSKSSINIMIPLNTLHFGNTEWQNKILGASFFDEKNFPTARFVSKKIERIDDFYAKIHGELSLRGVTLPVVLEMKLNAMKRHPLSFKKSVGASATTTLSRKAFGMNSWANLIGDEVKVKIEFEATREKNNAPTTAQESNDVVSE